MRVFAWFEIYFGAKHAEKMWNALLDAGKEFGLKPAGLGARDTLRLESCYSLYGDELDETISPVEASIEWVVKPAKGEFIGKKALEKQLKEGVKRKLVAIEMIDKGIPRHGYKIFKDDEEIGAITSGTFSPTFKKSIALGFVKTGHSSTGTGIYIDIRGKKYKARVSDKPFYSFHGKK